MANGPDCFCQFPRIMGFCHYGSKGSQLPSSLLVAEMWGAAFIRLRVRSVCQNLELSRDSSIAL